MVLSRGLTHYPKKTSLIQWFSKPKRLVSGMRLERHDLGNVYRKKCRMSLNICKSLGIISCSCDTPWNSTDANYEGSKKISKFSVLFFIFVQKRWYKYIVIYRGKSNIDVLQRSAVSSYHGWFRYLWWRSFLIMPVNFFLLIKHCFQRVMKKMLDL